MAAESWGKQVKGPCLRRGGPLGEPSLLGPLQDLRFGTGLVTGWEMQQQSRRERGPQRADSEGW